MGERSLMAYSALMGSYNPRSAGNFINGLETEAGEGRRIAGFVSLAWTVVHRGEEITEEDVQRRWERTAPHGPDEIRAVDFRPEEQRNGYPAGDRFRADSGTP